jgi:hypothetical protein
MGMKESMEVKPHWLRFSQSEAERSLPLFWRSPGEALPERPGNALGKYLYRLAAMQTSSSGAIINAITLGAC